MRDPVVLWNDDVIDYARDPAHVFTRKVAELIGKGALIVFAAGNTGGEGPYKDQPFTGPGSSIWGANGHPWVITVGAVDDQRRWMGYSSQGESSLHPWGVKPDIAAYSQYVGYLEVEAGFTYPDAGTSAAAPIVAGGLAVLKQKYPFLRQDVAAHVLRQTAIHPDSGSTRRVVDDHYGFGIIDFDRADEVLRKMKLTRS
jgi:subtilisin family serine protease